MTSNQKYKRIAQDFYSRKGQELEFFVSTAFTAGDSGDDIAIAVADILTEVEIRVAGSFQQLQRPDIAKIVRAKVRRIGDNMSGQDYMSTDDVTVSLEPGAEKDYAGNEELVRFQQEADVETEAADTQALAAQEQADKAKKLMETFDPQNPDRDQYEQEYLRLKQIADSFFSSDSSGDFMGRSLGKKASVEGGRLLAEGVDPCGKKLKLYEVQERQVHRGDYKIWVIEDPETETTAHQLGPLFLDDPIYNDAALSELRGAAIELFRAMVGGNMRDTRASKKSADHQQDMFQETVELSSVEEIRDFLSKHVPEDSMLHTSLGPSQEQFIEKDYLPHGTFTAHFEGGEFVSISHPSIYGGKEEQDAMGRTINKGPGWEKPPEQDQSLDPNFQQRGRMRVKAATAAELEELLGMSWYEYLQLSREERKAADEKVWSLKPKQEAEASVEANLMDRKARLETKTFEGAESAAALAEFISGLQGTGIWPGLFNPQQAEAFLNKGPITIYSKDGEPVMAYHSAVGFIDRQNQQHTSPPASILSDDPSPAGGEPTPAGAPAAPPQRPEEEPMEQSSPSGLTTDDISDSTRDIHLDQMNDAEPGSPEYDEAKEKLRSFGFFRSAHLNTPEEEDELVRRINAIREQMTGLRLTASQCNIINEIKQNVMAHNQDFLDSLGSVMQQEWDPGSSWDVVEASDGSAKLVRQELDVAAGPELTKKHAFHEGQALRIWSDILPDDVIVRECIGEKRYSVQSELSGRVFPVDEKELFDPNMEDGLFGGSGPGMDEGDIARLF